MLTVKQRNQLLFADADSFPATNASASGPCRKEGPCRGRVMFSAVSVSRGLARLWDCAFSRERRIPVAKGGLHELLGSRAVDSLSACPPLLRSLCEVSPCHAVDAAMRRKPRPWQATCSLVPLSLPPGSWEPLFVRARCAQTFL